MEMKKEYLIEFDAFGKYRKGFEQNSRNILPKISQIYTNLIRMLFKSRDEKRIFGIMNFQKKSRNGNEKRKFKII